MQQDYKQIADQIDTIGRNVATFYEPVVAEMHQVRMKARQFETLTADLKAASEPEGPQTDPESYVSIVDAAAGLRDAIGKARDVVTDYQLRTLLKTTQSHSDQLLRYSKELNSLSFLMLVTTASAAASGFTVEHLVSDLREMAKQLNKASSDIIVSLSLVERIRQDTGQVLEDTYVHIDQSLGHLEALTSAIGIVPQAVPGDSTPEQMADALSRDLGKLLPGLVACMQHPDAFAQRCDHVAQATRLLADDLNDDTDIALRRLIAAQMDDICEELTRIQADALKTLDGVAQKGQGTLDRFRSHLKNDRRLDAIAMQKDKVTETSRKLTNINKISQSALVDLSECIKQFDGVEAIFVRLDAMRQGVRTSSFNADLSERRAEINMPELRSVTKAVGECATSCGATIKELGDLYERIHSAFSQIDENSISDGIAIVEGGLSTSETELDAISDRVETIRAATTNCSDALHQLTELGNSAHARIASNVLTVKQLEQITNDLCGEAEHAPMDQQKVDGAIITRVFESYSIETERDVHRRVLPDAFDDKSEAKTAAPEDDDPLAEFLF